MAMLSTLCPRLVSLAGVERLAAQCSSDGSVACQAGESTPASGAVK